ncbi:MAG: hypothetical protein MHM6MM_004102 [Cercozoa sp. M6MM]
MSFSAENRNQDGGSNFSSQSSQRGRSRARGGRRGGGWRRNNSARSKDRGDDTVSRSYGEESGNSRNNSNNRRRRQRKPRSARENAPLAANSHASAKTNELDAVFEASSTETSSTFDKPSFITDQAFEEAPISTFSKRAISEVMGHKYMTKIQAESLPHVLGNKDVLGRARTGTGKTVAFLLPTIERIFGTEKSRSSRGTQVLVISPTRELAKQIATQSTELLKFRNEHATQVFMGGTNKSRDIRGFRGQAPSVLVATPGRLLDHLRTSDLIYDALQHVETLVLDEADVLLDMGFRRDVEAILKLLPKNRQTLLFSATTPPGLHEVISLALKNDFVTIDCISDGDANDDNNDNLHAHVPQRHVVLPSIETLVAALRAVITNDGQQGKFVVFFPTARVVGFFATLFRDVFRIPVLELHSRKSQNVRTRTSQQFRDARYGVLFTSDVSARGVDYPHVSHVVQVGMPSSKEQYIHRVGRTGRAGKEGQGLLMLCPFESVFLRDLRDMDVPRCDEWHTRLHDPQLQEESDKIRETLRREVRRSSNFHKAATQAYQAFLGFYNSNLKKLGWNKNKVLLVDKANEFAQVIGFDESPALLKRTVGKMGLKGVRGLRVQ